MEGKGAGEREAADLDLGLDIVDGVAALDLERDGLPRQRLHEDLHLAGAAVRDLEARVLRRPRSLGQPKQRFLAGSVDDDDDDWGWGLCGEEDAALLHIYTPGILVFASRSCASPRRRRAHDVSDSVGGGPRGFKRGGPSQKAFFGGWIRWAFLTWADSKIGLKGLFSGWIR